MRPSAAFSYGVDALMSMPAVSSSSTTMSNGAIGADRCTARRRSVADLMVVGTPFGSSMKSSNAVIVTVCGTFQLPGVNCIVYEPKPRLARPAW